jgi:hypothetical protein
LAYLKSRVRLAEFIDRARRKSVNAETFAERIRSEGSEIMDLLGATAALRSLGRRRQEPTRRAGARRLRDDPRLMGTGIREWQLITR